MLLSLIHGTVCEAQWVTVRMHRGWFQQARGTALRPQRNVLVFAWWCTTVNVCSFLLLFSSPLFSPTLSHNCLLCSLSLNNSPPLSFLSLPKLIFLFLSFCNLYGVLALLYSFPHTCSLCPPGVRAGDDISILQVHPHHYGKSLPILLLPVFGPLCTNLVSLSYLLPFFFASLCAGIAGKESWDERWGEEREKEKLWKCRGRWEKWKMKNIGFEVKVKADMMCSFSSFLPPDPFCKHPGFHLALWYTPLSFKHLN